jgi:hypothetical protein
MKKYLYRLTLAASVLSLSLGFTFFPITANAEEVIEDTESSSVLENGAQSSTTDENVTDEEVIEKTETNENSGNTDLESSIIEEEEKEEIKHNFEDFLAWMETEAERYGYGDEFSKALETIKTAASEKQVTLSTLGSLGVMVAVFAYTIYKKVTDKKFKDEVHTLSTSLNEQLKKLKELVDGTNNNTKTEEEIKAEEAALREEEMKIKNSLAHLINAFMHFSSHVGMSDTSKAEVQRDCMNALKCIDGEVTLNESNEK